MAVRCGLVLKLFKFILHPTQLGHTIVMSCVPKLVVPKLVMVINFSHNQHLLSNGGLSDANKCGILVNINIVIKLLLLQETN